LNTKGNPFPTNRLLTGSHAAPDAQLNTLSRLGGTAHQPEILSCPIKAAGVNPFQPEVPHNAPGEQ
jgi:hypothetical protein